MALGMRMLYNRAISTVIKFSTRNIMATGVRMEEALEKLQKNPYYEKYAERIAELQRTSPDEFLQRVEKQAESAPTPLSPVDTRQYSSVLNPKEKATSAGIVEPKRLDDIFKTDLVKGKSADEISSIWEEYHKGKDVIAAVVPAQRYEQLYERMRECPLFLLPLPREQGYEFMLCQNAEHQVHFTPLLAYQVHKENAPECLTMVHYPELADLGLVLMRGEYDKNVLSGKEAQCLANQFQLYYGAASGESRAALLDTFTTDPHSFRHTDLVRQLEDVTLA